jgi:hypothetical protein
MFGRRKQKKELAIPPAAMQDLEAIEIARIWAAEGKQHVTLTTGVWEDPAAWGLMLVDLARHIASAYAVSEGRSPSEVLARIRAGFDAEWDTPTDVPTGDLLRPSVPKL